MKTRAVTLAVWVVPFAVVATLLGTDLLLQSSLCKTYVCTDNVWRAYVGGARHWLLREPLYDLQTIDLFQYFPQAAILLIPFAALGKAGAILWRAFGWTLFASGLWRVTRRWELFLVVSVLAMAPSAMALLSGQSNLPLAAAMLHACHELGRDRPWRASFWLMLALACKPLALVPIGLALLAYPGARAPLAAAGAYFAVVPYATAPGAYVTAQYRACLAKLLVSAQPYAHRQFEELRGLVWKLGWSIPSGWLLPLQLLGALGAAVVVLRARRTWTGPRAALALYAVAAAYLMIFNPRNQPNSFVIAAPAAALPAAMLLTGRRFKAALPLLVILACWSGAAHFAEHWLKPLASITFAVLLVREVWRPRLV
jgi:hypothetical protein